MTRKDKNDVTRVWGLVRVSTTAQADVEHGSLEQQRHMLIRWADEQTRKTGVKHELRAEHIFEEDVSGRSTSEHKRTGLASIRRAFRTGDVDVVVIEKLDRLSRSQDLNQAFVKEANENGVQVYETESGIIDLKEKGGRFGFYLKNFMAEEYSLELEEKITKKQREARVNNGKDTSSYPVLGIDSHPTKAGFYVIVPDEVAIVRDIFEKFCELRSYRALADYANGMGYRTKVHYTKAKTKRGIHVPERKIGGLPFDAKGIRALLTSSKLRGYGVFEDTWNQFPSLQNVEKRVRWDYAHGAVVDTALVARVGAIIKSIEGTRVRKSESRGVYLLSGILKGADGSTFYGQRAKGGAYHYYYNSKSRVRLSANLMDEIVCKRIKTYLTESGILREVLEAALKQQRVGQPNLDAEIARANREIKALEEILESFTAGIRKAALSGLANLAEVCAALLDEKDYAAKELTVKQAALEDLRARKQRLKADLESRSLENYLQKAMEKFDTKSDLEKKRIVQSIIPEIIIKSDQEMVLMVNPAANGCHTRGNGVGIREEWRDGRDLNPRPPA